MEHVLSSRNHDNGDEKRHLLLHGIRDGVQETLNQVACHAPDSVFWFTAAAAAAAAATTTTIPAADDSISDNNNNNSDGTLQWLDEIMVERCIRVVSILQILAQAARLPLLMLLSHASCYDALSSSCSSLDPLLAKFVWYLYPEQATLETLQYWAGHKEHGLGGTTTTHPWDSPVPAWLTTLYQVHPRAFSVQEADASSGIWTAAIATGKSLSTLLFLQRRCLQNHHCHPPHSNKDNKDNNNENRNHYASSTALFLVALARRQQHVDATLQATSLLRARLQAAGRGHLGSVYQLWTPTRQVAAQQAAARTYRAEELSVVYTLLRQDVSVWGRNKR